MYLKCVNIMNYKAFCVFALFCVLNSCNSVVNSTENETSEDIQEYILNRILTIKNTYDLTPLAEAASDKKLVLLGEASHGTSEFYRMRADISKMLITDHDFNFIAVEGDWASLYRLNNYVKHKAGSDESAVDVLSSFDRWPVWMWANTDVLDLAEFLREYNSDKTEKEKVGFYGMDVYGHEASAEMLLSFVENHLPLEFEKVKSKLNCFISYEDPWNYARMVMQGAESCQDQLIALENLILSYENKFALNRQTAYFAAIQSARVVKNAEDYYRTAIRGGPDSWNSRVDHMYQTVQKLLDQYGENAKGIVWAHNTHIGDASATPMKQQGMFNIGFLSRQEMSKENVFTVGFGTYKGTVNAGRRWADQMQIMKVPEAINGSYEALFEQTGEERFLWIFNQKDREHPFLSRHIEHRAIGVVYNPAEEHRGNYVPTILPLRYDAFIFIRDTKALKSIK